MNQTEVLAQAAPTTPDPVFPFVYTKIPLQDVKPSEAVPERLRPLLGKITTPERMVEVIRECRVNNYCYQEHPSYAATRAAELLHFSYTHHHDESTTAANSIAANLGYYPGQYYKALPPAERFWMDRELIRQASGVYPPLPAQLELVIRSFRLGQYFIHMSLDQPDKVAYTPDVEAGKNDKQVTIGLGKLLRKLLLMVSDSYIQQIESAVRGVRSDCYFTTSDPAGLEYVYRNMAGDSGCMRHSAEHFKVDVHPARAYAAPGLAVAFTVDTAGAIKSRSVIFDNPDDPNDKRYVRIYGDGALKAVLMSKGYRARSLEGARLRRISQDPYTVVPYLDGPDGQQGHPEGIYGVTYANDKDYIQLLTSAGANALVNAGVSLPKYKNTAPKYVTPVVDPATFEGTCALSGRTYNKLNGDSTVLWMRDDGTIGHALNTETTSYEGPLGMLYRWVGRRETVFASKATRDRLAVAVPGDPNTWVLDEPNTLSAWDLARLSSRYYPDAPIVHLHECNTVAVLDEENPVFAQVAPDARTERIRVEDQVRVVIGTNSSVRGDDIITVHKDAVLPWLKSRKIVPCLSHAGFKTYAVTGHPALMKLDSNKRMVLNGLHPVVTTWDGKVMLSSKCVRVRWMGKYIWSEKGTDTGAAMWAAAYAQDVKDTTALEVYTGYTFKDLVERAIGNVGWVAFEGINEFQRTASRQRTDALASARGDLKNAVWKLVKTTPEGTRPVFAPRPPDAAPETPLPMFFSYGALGSFDEASRHVNGVLALGEECVKSTMPSWAWTWATAVRSMIDGIDEMMARLEAALPTEFEPMLREYCRVTECDFNEHLRHLQSRGLAPVLGQPLPPAEAAQAAEAVIAQADAALADPAAVPFNPREYIQDMSEELLNSIMNSTATVAVSPRRNDTADATIYVNSYVSFTDGTGRNR